ncbi:expressed unknown protein [Seminavis robusta]|uniref:Uncharacterized protein n=1 Tax=Seminavis robusta TaxID=568900 RepID=A0A9N8EQI4_9STRA|nr:expressed unknown protein [Seminavis robusta]|eukprot:Sro1443_g273110.1 n/a (83) ;mRNA; r:1346-1838
MDSSRMQIPLRNTTDNSSNKKRISFAKDIDFTSENNKAQRRLRKVEKQKKMKADLATLFDQLTDPLKAQSVFHWYSSNTVLL